jgi:hypothetical protein
LEALGFTPTLGQSGVATLWMKANLDSHAAKHQKNKLKNLLKKKRLPWESTRAQHMCALAKVNAPLFWKKYQPRAPIMDKINATTLLEGFCTLVGQSPPPLQLWDDHSAQVTKSPLSQPYFGQVWG